MFQTLMEYSFENEFLMQFENLFDLELEKGYLKAMSRQKEFQSVMECLS